METPSNKKPYSSNINGEDNISKLPDFLIHRILSLVKVKQAVQTSILSKRWTHVWACLPFLKFDDDADHYRDFVDCVFSFRDRCSDITRFHLLGGGSYGRGDYNRLCRWMMVVARSNVEDLCIKLSVPGEGFRVPGCVFVCNSLAKLELDFGKCKITLPSSVSLPCLKYLKLENTSFNHDDELTKLCSSCPVLEHLDLSGVSSTAPLNITVSSLTLKHFELQIQEHKSNHNDSTLRLYAPNLVYLGLSNLDDMLLENVSSLVMADIDAPVRPRQLNPEFPNDTLESLKQLHHVNDLTSSFQLVRDVRRVEELLQKQPFQYSNLQRMKLQKMSLSTDSMHVIATLLKISPIIESLALELCQEVQTNVDNEPLDYEEDLLDYDEDNEDIFENDEVDEVVFDEQPDPGSESAQEMESDAHTGETTLDLEGLFADTMKQLKSVKITGLEGSDIELKLIEILMKKGKVLRKMVLKKDVQCRSRDMAQFCEELDKFQHASSSLKIYLYM